MLCDGEMGAEPNLLILCVSVLLCMFLSGRVLQATKTYSETLPSRHTYLSIQSLSPHFIRGFDSCQTHTMHRAEPTP